MSKFYGPIGFSNTTETSPGVYEDSITEINYYGDVLRATRKWEQSGHLNDDISISNRISILYDPFAIENLHRIKYVTWMGTKWKVSDVEVEPPRLTLSIGGVYNE